MDPCIFRHSVSLLTSNSNANQLCIASPTHFMQKALFELLPIVKLSKSVTFAYTGCKWQGGSLLWNRAIESETHSMIHALAHTHKYTEIISFSAQQGNPLIHPHGNHKNGKRCPWCLKEKWPVKSQPFSCTACRIRCYFVSHGQVNLAKHVAGISIHAWLQHIWACVNDYTYMGLYKPHTGNSAEPQFKVNMKGKMQPI